MSGETEHEIQAGSCKWFNVLKGYGFITPDSGKEDIFVHQSQILMEGFRSLSTGERVKFNVRKKREGFEAIGVRSENETSSLKGSSIRPLGKHKTNVVRCYSCGRYGNHVAANCKLSNGNSKKICYRCQSTNHLLADCPEKKQF